MKSNSTTTNITYEEKKNAKLMFYNAKIH